MISNVIWPFQSFTKYTPTKAQYNLCMYLLWIRWQDTPKDNGLLPGKDWDDSYFLLNKFKHVSPVAAKYIINSLDELDRTNKRKGEVYLMLLKSIRVDFGEVKTAPTESKEKCFQVTSSAYLHYSKAPHNVLTLMIHLRKSSARWVIYE